MTGFHNKSPLMLRQQNDENVNFELQDRKCCGNISKVNHLMAFSTFVFTVLLHSVLPFM